jgi:hypothetical protein
LKPAIEDTNAKVIKTRPAKSVSRTHLLTAWVLIN